MEGHQLEGVDPLSYSVNRPVTAEARATMFELVRDSSTTLNTVASMLNKTYGLSLLPRDVYNRTYDHGQRHGSSTVKFLEKLDQDGYLYRVRVGPENTLDSLFFTEYHISRYANFGMNTTSRVEGSHAALKRSLSSSSGTLYAAGQRISYRDAERSTQNSIVGATENLVVRVDIRNQLETSMLCTRISRSALELVYTEVLKKVHNQEEDRGASLTEVWDDVLASL
ncbi:hypothetical protein LIPSTDRAFT_275981 [Lipomyces starkeyi NRRL Y-11557]|uniref:Uncharacterized protein n=1 Tax=Lipomyces starkeyi NRRL Y-11557 TaxID=675824 RepID=A0A1E3Q8A5_LIPST|nr:hypothetical protein LIPSTDRAFT_275981 [Lipomyces starkeyi NRRL Y-11557]